MNEQDPEQHLRTAHAVGVGRAVHPRATGMLQVNRSVEWFGTHKGSFGIRAQATSYGPMYVWPASDSAEAPAVLTTDGDANLYWAPISANLVSTLGASFDGGASVLTVGKTADLWVPFGFTIQEVTLLAKETGSVQMGVWATTYANFPPTSSNSITGTATPAIASDNKYKDTTLTTWTTSFASDMTVRFNIDSVSTIKQVVFTAKITKTGTATGLQGAGGDYGQGATDSEYTDATGGAAARRGGGNANRGPGGVGAPWPG